MKDLKLICGIGINDKSRPAWITNTGLSRGRWPIGVYFHEQRSKFMAYCSVNGKDKYLGYFATPEEAHAVYKQFKENLCKELANKWRGKIDERVYNAMMVWSVTTGVSK